MTKRKKIAVVIGNLDVGGAEKDIVRNYPLINKTHDVIILLYSHRGKLAAEIEKLGIKVICIPPKKIKNKPEHKTSFLRKIILLFKSQRKSQNKPEHKISFLRKIILLYSLICQATITFLFLRSQIKSEKVDIIHAFLPLSYVYASFIKMSIFYNKPILIMSRLSLNFYFAKHKILEFLEKRICHKIVDIAVGNSKAILNDLSKEGVPEHKLFLLYNGIDVNSFHIKRDISYYTKTEILQITSIGNLFSYKGHGDLLQALNLLRNRRPDLLWYLNIIGRDEQNNLKKYQNFISDNNLGNHINLVGAIQNVRKFLHKSHLHIHPSHTEGLPNAIIEAMSSSLACIATNVGGIPELIDHNKTGLIVPPNSPDELSIAIEIMLDNRENLYYFGEAAQKKAAKLFSTNNSVSNYLRLYEL